MMNMHDEQSHLSLQSPCAQVNERRKRGSLSLCDDDAEDKARDVACRHLGGRKADGVAVPFSDSRLSMFSF